MVDQLLVEDPRRIVVKAVEGQGQKVVVVLFEKAHMGLIVIVEEVAKVHMDSLEREPTAGRRNPVEEERCSAVLALDQVARAVSLVLVHIDLVVEHLKGERYTVTMFVLSEEA